MEKLKQSEEEIIKLGKKIVEELQLEHSVNTLGRWMSHYVAELINEIENSPNEVDKAEKKKECFDIILKLWSNRKHLDGVSKPLDDLKPLIELLDVLKKEDNAYPYWGNYRENLDEPTWKNFVDKLKNNAEKIFMLCLYTTISNEILERNKEWIQEYGNLLTEEELSILNHFNDLINYSNKIKFILPSDKEENINLIELSTKERYAVVLDKIQENLDELNDSFALLKDETMFDVEEI